MYLVLHVFQIKSDGGSLRYAFDREVEPSPVVILGVVGGDPEIELSGVKITWLFPIFSTLQQFPESKSELTVTD